MAVAAGAARFRCGAFAVLLAVGACTTPEPGGRIHDGADPLRMQLVALDSAGNFVAEDLVSGAAIGAVSGGLIGGLAPDDWRGALIGAGVGGAAGGYLVALQRQNADQQSLVRKLTSDIDRENLAIDRTQAAFDQLLDARFMTAQRIRESFLAGRVDRAVAQAQLAEVQRRLRSDVALARQISERISSRGGEFDTALEAVQPGVKQQVAGARVSQPVPATPRVANVTLKLRPDGTSPTLGQLAGPDGVTVKPATGGYVLVEGPGGVRGFAPASQFAARGVNLAQGSAPPPPTPVALSIEPPMPWQTQPPEPTARQRPGTRLAAASPQEPFARQLAASTIMRRDNFADSVANAQQVAEGPWFELPPGGA
jgi:hypothetical protein